MRRLSSGSANLASYVAGQRGHSYAAYTDDVFRREYACLNNALKKGELIDSRYLYHRVWGSGGEEPLDFPAIRKNSAQFFLTPCNAAKPRDFLNG